MVARRLASSAAGPSPIQTTSLSLHTLQKQNSARTPACHGTWDSCKKAKAKIKIREK